MDESIKRTEQEIDDQIAKGQGFIDQHPQTIFGDDNTGTFKDFQELCKLAKEGKSANYLRHWAKDRDYKDPDGESVDSDQQFSRQNEALSGVDWLTGESEEAPYS